MYQRKTETHSYVELKKTKAVSFGFLDPDEILKLSVCNIHSERIYDDLTLLPKFGGVNDPRMGVTSRDQKCYTCLGDMVDCPGHFGHIELARPVYHVGLIDAVRQVLKVVCFNCSRLMINCTTERASIAKISHPQQRFYRVLTSVEKTFKRKCDQENGGCGFNQPKFTKKSLSIMIQRFDNQEKGPNQQTALQADQALEILQKISQEDANLIGFKRPELMIIRRLAVAPPCVRPSVNMGGLMKSEDDLTYSYQQIVKNSNLLRLQVEKGANQITINELTMCLQFYVATLMDNAIAGAPTHKHKSGKPLKAIKERLKGKEGRVRSNLMGKRVDFSARSVITPDPSLDLDELGVPIRVAINMTVPETVTQYNIDEMRNLVANGPNHWPGAKYIQRLDNQYVDLSVLMNRTDVHLEIGYTVERHLRNGDYVIFNRQPSLHKMSTMGHRVKVLPFSTFRLNLAVTSPYNADFDGDEMNMFVPQGLEAKAEVKEIMHVPRQIVSPQSNKPVMGIVQDSLLGIMLFTKRDTFIPKGEAMQLLMNLQSDFDQQNRTFCLPQPAVLKPVSLWTGKQIMSIFTPDINFLRGQSILNGKTDYAPIKDKMVLIQRGELISGELTKSTVGAASGGLNHLIWKEKGSSEAKDFLSTAQKVVNAWLVGHGFSVGVSDAVPTLETKQNISKTLKQYKKKVFKIISQAHLGTLQCQPGKNIIDSFEASVNTALNEARDKAGTQAFTNLSDHNHIQNMVSCGSKGTNINISQIMACVGQQNVEGKRIPFGFGDRSLPHFSRHDYGPESKGFVSSNYITGLDPSEFYFHAMGGREGLIDTAIKTAETGYIQRRLVKALEDIMVRYDSTVRNSQGTISQFLYGEDGMAGEAIEDLRIESLRLSDQEITKRFEYKPTEETLKTFIKQQTLKAATKDPSITQIVKEEFLQLKQDRDTMRSAIFRNGDDQIHLPLNIQRMLMSCKQIFDLKPNYKARDNELSDLKPQYVITEVKRLCDELTVFQGRPNAGLDKFLKLANEFATQLAQIYIRQSLSSKRLIMHEQLNVQAFDWMVGEIKSRFESSIAHPGEVVGSIAAQCVGEPATQMTLNTFHFAGVSSKNVTLGVPRLKEIINVAKNIKTPMMSIYLKQEFIKNEESVMRVQRDLEYTTIMDVIESSQIYFDPDPNNSIILEDQQLVQLYSEVQVSENSSDVNSPWLLRLVLSQQQMMIKQVDIDMIEERLSFYLGDLIQIMHSDINADIQVIRIRFKNLRDENEDCAVHLIQECENDILNEIMLKGIPEIQKVYAKKMEETEFCQKTGEVLTSNDNWMLETDGVCLQKILGHHMIDATRTISNDIIEIKNTLGIEAGRQSILNELRNVLGFYGIYINSRHLSTLCDVMVQKGRLTSITRHGINRLDTGPLRKCSFEETVEILLAASMHNERDQLLGVTENIMLGQLAPIGTGSFDVIMDLRMVNECGKEQQGIYDENDGNGTPLMHEEHGNYGQMTPCVDGTPNYMGGGRSEYGTPGGGVSQYDANFSPSFNMLASPGYGSPHGFASSPGYGSPTSPTYGAQRIKLQSPLYGGNVSSPLYGGGSGQVSPTMMQSPNYYKRGSIQAQSPNYSPAARQSPYGQPTQQSNAGLASIIKSNYSPNYSPSAQAPSPMSNKFSPSLQQAASPSYSPSMSGHMPYNSMQSPNYSPNNPTGSQYGKAGLPLMKQNFSPNYSPSGAFNPSQKQSPAYSPNALSVNRSPHVPAQLSKHGESPFIPQAIGFHKVAYMPPTENKLRSPVYNPATSPQYKQEDANDK